MAFMLAHSKQGEPFFLEDVMSSIYTYVTTQQALRGVLRSSLKKALEQATKSTDFIHPVLAF